MSTLNSYGVLQVKRVEFADQLISHGAADDDYELTISCTNQAADRTLTIPALSGNQTILHDGSTIAGAKLNINGTAAITSGADADEMILYDASGSANKKITLTNLNNYFGSTPASNSITTAMLQNDCVDADKLASNAVVDASVASNAAIAFAKLAALDDTKILVGNGSNVAVKVAVSGDATLANNGALTIANNAINAAKLANDAVDTNAIEDDAVTSGKLGAGACDAAALGVTAGAVSASKSMVVDSSKDISGGRHFTTSGNSTAGEFHVGGANKWKLRVNGSNMELQKYNSGSSAWETKQVFTP